MPTRELRSTTWTEHPLVSPVLPVGAKEVFVFLDRIFCSHRKCGLDSQLVAATGTPARPIDSRDHRTVLSNASDAEGRCSFASAEGRTQPSICTGAPELSCMAQVDSEGTGSPDMAWAMPGHGSPK